MRRCQALAFLLLSGCAVAPAPGPPMPSGNAVIYVVGRGWHTDIGLPADAMTGPLARLADDFPGVRYMVFGFGERAYLMARRADSGEMLAALFPSESAILLTALRAPPAEAFADQEVVMLKVPQANADRIAALIWRSLTTAEGAPHRLADGPYAGSAFYASNETYDMFHTCNTWTARLLHDAGLPVDPDGVLFVGQLMHQVEQIAAAQRRARP